jgi:SAM-dependent methyltransferase
VDLVTAEDKGYEKVAHFYDFFATRPNVEFFYHYAKKASQILDIGAGTGRLALPLAEKGIEVFCVEPSPAMRRVFEEKLGHSPHLEGKITLIPGEAHSFDYSRRFPVACLSATFDHFLTDEERIASLSNIARHLEPAGTLVFDVFFGYMKDEELSAAGEAQVGDMTYKRFVGGEVVGNIKQYLIVFEIHKKGKLIERIEQHSQAGIADYDTLHCLLTRIGFKVKQEFSDYERTPYKEGDELLVIEAVKKEDK